MSKHFLARRQLGLILMLCAVLGCNKKAAPSPSTEAERAKSPIRVGVPMILSGAGAQFGTPIIKGMQMLVDEENAKGGVLGRQIEIITRDTKSKPDEAVRVSRELLERESVDFLAGTLTSGEGPAVSTVAKTIRASRVWMSTH